MEGFVGAQQRADSIREKYACEREYGGGAELKEYPVAEHIVCAIHVPLADADGIDRNASNADEHIHRAYHQYGGTGQIDCPQRVCPAPPLPTKIASTMVNRKKQTLLHIAGITYWATVRSFALCI